MPRQMIVQRHNPAYRFARHVRSFSFETPFLT